MKRILYIAADYPPDSTPGATRAVEMVKHMSDFGYEIVVVTENHASFPKKPTWKIASDSTTIDDSSSAGRRKVEKHSDSKFGKLLNKLAALLPMDGTWWGLDNLVKKAVAEAKTHPFDLIFVTCNPLSASWGGVKIIKKLQVPLVVEFRDPWTLHPRRSWQSWFHYQLEMGYEKKVIRAADQIILNTMVSRDWLIRKRGAVAERSHFIPHGFEPERYSFPESSKSDGEFIDIGFVGSFYYQCDLSRYNAKKSPNPFAYSSKWRADVDREQCSPKPLFDALIQLREENTELASKVRVKLVGALRPGDKAYVKQHRLEDMVVDCPRLAPREVPGFLNSCDALYLTNIFFTDIASPFISTKTVEYLASRKPVIANLPEGDNRTLVEKSGMGMCCHPGSGFSVYDRIVQLAGIRQKNSDMLHVNEDFICHFERKHHAKCLADVFDKSLELQPLSSVCAVDL